MVVDFSLLVVLRFYLGQCEADCWKLPLLLFPVFSADFYYFSRFKLKDKCRSAKWELFLYGVMSIKVDRDRVEVVAQGCASALVLHPTWQRTTLHLCVVPAF